MLDCCNFCINLCRWTVSNAFDISKAMATVRLGGFF